MFGGWSRLVLRTAGAISTGGHGSYRSARLRMILDLGRGTQRTRARGRRAEGERGERARRAEEEEKREQEV